MPPQDDNSPALSVSKSKGKGLSELGCAGGCFLSAFLGVFLLAGLGVMTALFFYPAWNIMRSSSWVKTPCIIQKCELKGSDTFSIDIEYTYEVNRRPYTGTRYNFLTGASSVKKWKQDFVNQHPPGTNAHCYVNPADPSESVFNRDFTNDMWFGLFGVPFFLIGAGGVYGVSRARAAERKKQSLLRQSADEPADSDDHDDPRDDLARRIASTASKPPRIRAWSNDDFASLGEDVPDEPVMLEPQSTPTGNFIGCLVISVIFHGVLAFFFYSRIQDWQQGKWEWFPDIFAIPAGLGSLTCIAGIIHSFLALFNPKPVLTLSRQAIPLGGQVTLEWFFTGNPNSIRSLAFQLEGMESAKYTRGTNTTTDTYQFHVEVLHSTTDPIEIAEGKADLTIPDDTMHSLFGTNNKILWQLKLVGEIPFWPNVSTTFPIKVIPHEPFAGH